MFAGIELGCELALCAGQPPAPVRLLKRSHTLTHAFLSPPFFFYRLQLVQLQGRALQLLVLGRCLAHALAFLHVRQRVSR